MKDNKDVARGWIKKAESDLENVETMIKNSKSFDTACFHAQQAAEKYLKAFLCFNGKSFPRTHDIEELIELCLDIDKRFSDILEETIFLTDYAVELRYDFEFWPEKEDAESALRAANKIKHSVLMTLSNDINSESNQDEQ